MKEIYIADLVRLDENKPFDSTYLVLSKQQRTTKTAKPYLILSLGDNSGQIESRIWDPLDPRIAQDFNKGDVVKVRGCVSRFEGVLQLKVDQLRKVGASEFDRMDLLPSTTYDIDGLWAQLEQAVAGFTNPYLQLLVNTMLAEPQLRAAFREAPAAKQLHHAFLGGLLEHVVSLVGLAERVVPHYPILMKDLVLTGVILHDIGKIRELAWETGFEYTLEGTLLGHIQIGASMIEKVIDSIPGFPQRLKILVLHVILSHHGKLEFGSPKLPMIPEALMLNFLDDMDAKMQTLVSEFQKAARQGKGPGDMTDRIWALDQRTMLNSRAWLAEDRTVEAEVPAESIDTATTEAEQEYQPQSLLFPS
ncbi:3'-5' exoribonuclease YhaM family protein [Acidicapsa ligni]|uniref:3'-5' exoribonuclease YhaM family protein n=1 Tax=Acidicapsa ligni TaxID=542300 RepID=UPI0021DF871A|nr:HD domain-containing protein [Acidicapsa ligni]